MEVFELLLLIVAKLLGEYLIKSFLCIGLSIAFLFFNESNSIYIEKKIQFFLHKLLVCKLLVCQPLVCIEKIFMMMI